MRPLLAERCIGCHGPLKQSGGLRLDSRTALLRGGDSGPAVVSGKPDESLMLKAVMGRGDLRMPPKGKLTDGEVAKLQEVIRRGLPWPPARETVGAANALVTEAHRQWWAFQRPRPVIPPQVRNQVRPRSEIDRFILAGLEARGMQPAPPRRSAPS